MSFPRFVPHKSQHTGILQEEEYTASDVRLALRIPSFQTGGGCLVMGIHSWSLENVL